MIYFAGALKTWCRIGDLPQAFSTSIAPESCPFRSQQGPLQVSTWPSSTKFATGSVLAVSAMYMKQFRIPNFKIRLLGAFEKIAFFYFCHVLPLARCYMHLWFRWKAPQMTLKFFPWVYYMIICYVGPAWGHSGTHGGPKMAQNSTKKADNVSKSPEWLKMALHDAHFVTCDPGIKTFWYHHPFDAMYIQRI